MSSNSSLVELTSYPPTQNYTVKTLRYSRIQTKFTLNLNSLSLMYILSKTLFYFFMPSTIISVLMLWGLLTKNINRKIRLFTISIALFFVFTNPFLADEAMRLLEDDIKPTPTSVYNYGIVLTGVTMSEKKPYEMVKFSKGADRVYHAVELYKKGIIKKIIITGGSGLIIGNAIPESITLKKAMLNCGVNESDITIETKSRNTWENAIFTAEILKKENYTEKALVITSAFHMKRTTGCFSKAGIKFDTYPVDFSVNDRKWTPNKLILPSEEAFSKWKIIIHELIGIISYKLLGRG